jgi:hypothetical protein
MLGRVPGQKSYNAEDSGSFFSHVRSIDLLAQLQEGRRPLDARAAAAWPRPLPSFGNIQAANNYP